jgi:hypothetical protein
MKEVCPYDVVLATLERAEHHDVHAAQKGA